MATFHTNYLDSSLYPRRLCTKLECSFKSEKKCGGEAELPLSPHNLSVSLRSLEIDVAAGQERSAGSRCGEMKHAAAPGAADDLGIPFFLSSSSSPPPSQRDTSHRPGSCCFFMGYYRLIASQLSERESPHRSWTCALFLCFLCPRGGWDARITRIFWFPPSSHIFFGIIQGDMLYLFVIILVVLSDAGRCFMFTQNIFYGHWNNNNALWVLLGGKVHQCRTRLKF